MFEQKESCVSRSHVVLDENHVEPINAQANYKESVRSSALPLDVHMWTQHGQDQFVGWAPVSNLC